MAFLFRVVKTERPHGGGVVVAKMWGCRQEDRDTLFGVLHFIHNSQHSPDENRQPNKNSRFKIKPPSEPREKCIQEGNYYQYARISGIVAHANEMRISTIFSRPIDDISLRREAT